MLGPTPENVNELVWVQPGYLELSLSPWFSGTTRAENWDVRRKYSKDQVVGRMGGGRGQLCVRERAAEQYQTKHKAESKLEKCYPT